jgi:hypothetical protein
MKPPFRSKQEVIINAPLETVWEFNMGNCREQAIALKFRLLSIRFTSEAFVCNRKMSVIAIYRQSLGGGPQRAQFRSCPENAKMRHFPRK